MRSPGRLVGVVLLTSIVGACASVRSYDASEAQTDLIGQNKNTIYGCAGVPNRRAVVNGIEYLTYENSSFVQLGLQMPLFGGGVSDLESQYCVATFALTNDKVIWLGYAGDTGPLYGQYAQCDYIVRACREMVKQHPELTAKRAS